MLFNLYNIPFKIFLNLNHYTLSKLIYNLFFLLFKFKSNTTALYITKFNYKLLILIIYSVSFVGDYGENKSKLLKIFVDNFKFLEIELGM